MVNIRETCVLAGGLSEYLCRRPQSLGSQASSRLSARPPIKGQCELNTGIGCVTEDGVNISADGLNLSGNKPQLVLQLSLL
jgi:hypothetical protein